MTKKINIKAVRILGLSIGLIAFLIDQISKWWILNFAKTTLLPHTVYDFFNLTLVFNRGVSFSFFSNSSSYTKWVLIILSFAICIFFTHWLWRSRSHLLSLGLGLIVGGAAGNIVDRFCFNAVIDFLDFHWKNNHFATFNIADAAITCGAILIIFIHFFQKHKL